jgi:hypothetical protein
MIWILGGLREQGRLSRVCKNSRLSFALCWWRLEYNSFYKRRRR